MAAGQADLGFVAVEYAIEGTVNATLDTLIFETDLYIQREVVLPVHQPYWPVPARSWPT